MQTYFISNGRAVKIGRARRPAHRLRQLQTAHPQPLTLVATLDGDQEASLHRRFAGDRLEGEWFILSERIQAFIDQVNGVVRQPTFAEWLLAQRHRVDAVGQLARRVADDTTFPRGKNTPLHRQLAHYEALPAVRRAVKFARTEWRKSLSVVATPREVVAGSEGAQ